MIDTFAPSSATTQHLTGTEKAAVLLMHLPQDVVGKILTRMRDSEVSEVTSAITRMGAVDASVSDAVLSEFLAMSEARREAAIGGVATARAILEATYGPERADEILSQMQASISASPFAFLRKVDPRQIVGVLREEHPQVTALVVSYLERVNADQAALVISGLDEDVQQDVSYRIATIERTPNDVVRQIESTIERRLASAIQSSGNDDRETNGVQVLVDILNRSDRATERIIFEGLEQRNPEIAEEVRRRMFVFEDIATLDDRTVQRILRDTDSKTLAIALKGVSSDVTGKIFANMSERARESLQEEMSVIGAQRLKVVGEAQGTIVQTIRSLEEAEEIFISRGSDTLVS